MFKHILGYILAGVALALALIPMFHPETFNGVTHFLPDQALRNVVFVMCAPLVIAALSCVWLDNMSWGRRLSLAAIFLALTLLIEYINLGIVDPGQYFPGVKNVDWQFSTHRRAVMFDPTDVPHSYRFLPSGIVAFFEYFTGNFFFSKFAYRIIFDYLILLVIFMLSAQFVGRVSALLTVFLYVLMYPVTIQYMAGQLTDPASHLSFFLCMLFLTRKQFIPFTLALVAGVLAKESILVMAGCWALFASEPRLKAFGKGALAGGLGLGLVVLVRYLSKQGDFSAHDISGVNALEHMYTNLAAIDWRFQVFFSVVILIPLCILHWGRISWQIKGMILLLAPVIFTSSMLFSWLREARNYVPFMVLMLMMNADFLVKRFWPWLSDPVKEEQR